MEVLRRTRPLLLLPPALVVALGLDQGGFDPSAWVWSGALAAWAAALAAVARGGPGASRRAWLWVAAGCLLLAWTSASALWSDRRTQTLLEARRTTVYAAVALALVAAAQPGSARRMAVATHAAVTGLVVYALGRYLFGSHPVDPFEGSLLAQPLGYANAVGVLAAIGTALGVGLSFAQRRPVARAATAASVPVLAAALALSHSRGSVLGLVVGLMTMAALAGARRLLLPAAVAAAAGVAAIAVAGWTQPRTSLWHVAWREFTAHPAVGSGAGTFALAWVRSGLVASRGGALDAHSLYLETLAELGLVGLVLLAAFLLLPLVALRDRSPWVVAAAGGYAVFLVHAGVDWDWEMPAVVVAGLCSGAAILSGAAEAVEPTRLPSAARRIAIAALAAVLGVASIVGARSSAEPGVAPAPLLVVPATVALAVVAVVPVPVAMPGRSGGGARRQRVAVAQVRG